MFPTKTVPDYAALSRYLDGRYAETVVLRLSEMDDILGFKLPSQAREQADWWSNQNSDQSTCWTAANRTAKPNLTAQTVTFTRGAV